MPGDFTDALSQAVARHIGSSAATRHIGSSAVTGLRRLSGGASLEIWAFEVAGSSYVLRRVPPALLDHRGQRSLALPLEARLQIVARAHGVPAPEIAFVLDDQDGLGPGYVMVLVPGETIARKILRDADFDTVRPKLAPLCGTILSGLHAVPTQDLGDLPVRMAAEQFAEYRTHYEAFDQPHGAFELAFRWLERHIPEPVAPCLVHGDFRNGNLMIQPQGIAAVLDWELAHLGDCHEDLSWICVNAWRFGNLDRPVGGFGQRAELYAAYEAAGGHVDPERAHFWEVLGTLKWGIICMLQCSPFLEGSDRSVERAAIGRRVVETDLDLLILLE